MKRVTRSALIAALLVGGMGSFSAANANELSYNIGFASEYHYRGILQKNSSASAGVDFNADNGFYIGTWAADVGDGLEVDIYGGWGFETGDFTGSIGFTGYYYTGEFDDTYEEVNLNLGYGIFGLEYSVGEWEGFGDSQDYDFLAGTFSFDNGIYLTYGTFGDDFDGDYIELGWGTTIAEIDFGVAVIRASDELSDQLDSSGNPTEGESLVFTIGKTF